MPTARRSRTLAADPSRVWAVVEDPHHLPRWWPGVRRTEGVATDHWTEVYITKKGRPVRSDFRLLESDPQRRRCWTQELAETPFERVLIESVVEIELEPAGEGTRVTITQRQRLRGTARTGAFLLRRATARRLGEALDGLERIA